MTKSRVLFMIISVLLFQQANSNDTLFINKQSEVRIINKEARNFKVIKFGEGTFFIPNLVFTQIIKLVGDPAGTILKPGKNVTQVLIRSYDNLFLKKIFIDGDNILSVGVYVSKDLYVDSCNIQNFHGDKKRGGRAIRTTGDKSKLIVMNSVIKNIDGYEDGIVGNSIGANRGVYSNANYIRISNTVFENIFGKEDGDAVHFQTKRNSNMRWSNSNSIIENCHFINFGKRAIKLASSNNTIRNCYFTRNNDRPADVAISMYGDNNFIIGNEFDIAVDIAWVTFSGARYSTLQENRVNMTKTSRLFYVTKTTASIIENNEFAISNRDKPLSGFSPNTDKSDFSNITTANKIIYTK